MDDIDERGRGRAGWTDEKLTTELTKAAADERGALVELLLNLAEFDRRSLSEKYACSSLFDYCTRKLGYSSSEAGRRIAVARTAKRFPILLRMIEHRELHLSGAGMLAGLLTSENHAAVLRTAAGKSQDQIACMVAALAPRSVPKDYVRALRAPAATAGLARPTAPPTSVARSIAMHPDPARADAMVTAAHGPDADLLGAPDELETIDAQPELYYISFSASRQTRDMLSRAKEVLRHRFPKARTNEVVNLALRILLAKADRDLRRPPKPMKAEDAGAKRSRYIPEAVK